MTLPYTICFCRRGDLVLMLHRRKPPNRHRWNGLGGRLEPPETPRAGVRREVLEEAAIDLRAAARLRFSGVVTWAVGDNPTRASAGMYAYVAELAPDWPVWSGDRPTPEGLLGWKPLAWVCDPANGAVVDNIPRFLPTMLAGAEPREYACTYRDGRLAALDVRPLAPHLRRAGALGE